MDLLLRILSDVRQSLAFQLFGYVIMPDHAHLLLLTRVKLLPHIMHQWKFKSAYAIQQLRRVSGPFWQRRYFDFICRRNRDLSLKLEYIHQNPVARSLVTVADAWRWSSAASYRERGGSPIEPDLMDFSGDPDELLWPAPFRRR